MNNENLIYLEKPSIWCNLIQDNIKINENNYCLNCIKYNIICKKTFHPKHIKFFYSYPYYNTESRAKFDFDFDE